MESSEEQLFAQLEREMSTDLSGWRRTLMGFYQDALVEVYKVAPGVADEGGDAVNSENVRSSMGAVLREIIHNNWYRIEQAPTKGNLVSVAGNGIFQVFNKDTRSFEAELLSGGGVLQGELDGVDVQPYIDEECLMFDPEAISNLDIEKFIKPFGLHLVLQNATIIGHEDSDFSGSCLYIPLQYSEMKLSTYAVE